jgi:hypothetical protein
VTIEQIEKHCQALEQQRDKFLALLNQVEGAITEANFWKSQLEEAEQLKTNEGLKNG